MFANKMIFAAVTAVVLAGAPVAQQACYIDPVTGARVCPQSGNFARLRARIVTPRQVARYQGNVLVEELPAATAQSCPDCPAPQDGLAMEGAVVMSPVEMDGVMYERQYVFRGGRWFPGKLVLRGAVGVARGGVGVVRGGARVVRGGVRLVARNVPLVGGRAIERRRMRRASRFGCGG